MANRLDLVDVDVEKTLTFQFTGTGNKFNLIMRMTVDGGGSKVPDCP